MDAPPPATTEAPAPQPAPPVIVMAWSRSAQLATACLLVLATSLLAVHAYGYLRWGTRPTTLELRHRIDLNQAERAELLQLPGIGTNLAKRIEDHRRQNGAFPNVEALTEVTGIGPATLERLRPWLRVHSMADG